jgi:hypothetical protein
MYLTKLFYFICKIFALNTHEMWVLSTNQTIIYTNSDDRP